jgi:hypothetical protein
MNTKSSKDMTHILQRSIAAKRLASLWLAAAGLSLAGGTSMAQSFSGFNVGDLVLSYVSDQVSPTITAGALDSASPIALQQFSLSAGGTVATADGAALILPQTASGANSAISGEFGSASEGLLQQSVNGQYLTIMGYGVSASTFNSDVQLGASSPYGTGALGQTISLTGGSSTVVPRVVALIGGNGSVDTTTALTGVFNMNNPRSVATVDGSSFYVSGQGVTGDGTGGLFYATHGATTATPINNNTSASPTGTNDPSVATETRSVQIVNTGSGNTLMVSRDAKVSGTPNDATDIRSFTGPGGALPTSATGLTTTRVLPSSNSVNGGNTASIDLTAALANGINNSRIGKFVYLSPEEFFMASPSVMYVADSGQPKNGNANAAALGEGGLQKWINSQPDGSGTWSLAYDLVNGLNLVNNANANSSTPTAPGVTGLFGLTGEVVGGNVELFATSYGLNELSQSYLYEITDTLSDTTISQASSEQFTTLYTDSTGQTSLRGVAFAPTPEPGSAMLLSSAGGCLLGLARRRKRSS